MIVITTKFYGPTNTKGARVVASTSGGHRHTVGYDYANGPLESHRKAATGLRDSMGWSGRLVGGDVTDGVMAWLNTDHLVYES